MWGANDAFCCSTVPPSLLTACDCFAGLSAAPSPYVLKSTSHYSTANLQRMFSGHPSWEERAQSQGSWWSCQKKKKKTIEKDVQINEHEYYYYITAADFTQQFPLLKLWQWNCTHLSKKEPSVAFYKAPHGYLYTSNKVWTLVWIWTQREVITDLLVFCISRALNRVWDPD